MFSDMKLGKTKWRGGLSPRRGLGAVLAGIGIAGAFGAKEAAALSQVTENGKTFNVAADVAFELLENGSVNVTDAIGQVFEIAPEHFIVQDGQLFLLNTMYSAVGGQIMAVGDAIAASLMGLGVLGAAAGAAGPTSPTEVFEGPPKGIEEVYSSGDLAGGAGGTTEIS